MKYPNLAATMAVCVLSVLALLSTATAYDGPAGVTFRSPFIAKGAGTDAVTLEGVSVKVKARIDDNWSLKTDGKGRAFPYDFVATIADSEFLFRLRNHGGQKVAATILIPFDASNTEGTGFTKPLSIAAFWDGRPVGLSRGPDFPRGMMKVGSFRVPVEMSPGSTVTLKVAASHQLAMIPAWYQFKCTDSNLRFSHYRNLSAEGCDLELQFDSADERLEETDFKFEWKKRSQETPIMEQHRGKIRFRSESVERVRVSR